MRSFLFLLIAITFAPGAFAAENGDCEARLGTHSIARNILGVIRTSLRNGGMTIEAVRVLAGSESPVNPLTKMTPTSINTAARRALTALVSDPLAHAMWPETRKALNDLLKLHENDDQKRKDASHATRKLVLPTPIGNAYKNTGYSTSVVTLPNEVVVAARFNGDKIEVIRLSDGELLYTWPVPPCATDVERQQRRLAWHRDRHEKLWLYSASSSNHSFYFQRMDPQNPMQPPVQISNDVAHGYVSAIRDYSADFIVVQVGSDNFGVEHFNLSGEKLEDVTQAFQHPALTKEPLPPGVNFPIKMELPDPSTIYITRQGKKLLLEVDKNILRATDLSDKPAKPLEFDLPAAEEWKTIDCYETKNGRILLAVSQGGSEGQHVFYALDAGKNPIYLHKTIGWTASTQWFQGPGGEPLFAYTTSWDSALVLRLHVVDPEARSVPVPEYKFGLGKTRWVSYHDRTFITIFADRKTRVIDLFAEVPP